MKIFFDTNVLVAAFTTRGLCADLLRHVLSIHELVCGEFVIEELRKTLIEKFKVPSESVRDILRFLRDYPIVPVPQRPLKVSIRDPDDIWVLTSAVESKAEILVTGDKDLLELKHKLNLLILNPRNLWVRLKLKTPRPSS